MRGVEEAREGKSVRNSLQGQVKELCGRKFTQIMKKKEEKTNAFVFVRATHYVCRARTRGCCCCAFWMGGWLYSKNNFVRTNADELFRKCDYGYFWGVVLQVEIIVISWKGGRCFIFNRFIDVAMCDV